MIKIFVIASLIYGIFLIVFAYRYKGMRICFIVYLIIGALMIQTGIIRNEPIREKKEIKEEKVERNEPVVGVVLRKTLCVTDPNDIDDLVDAIKRKDVEFLDQLVIDGKAFFVTMDARVLRSESQIVEGIVWITFMEGRHKNQGAYTFKKCVPTEEEYMAKNGKMYIP